LVSFSTKIVLALVGVALIAGGGILAFGKLKDVFSNLKLPELPSFNLPNITNIFSPAIPSDPNQQTEQQQLDLFGQLISESEGRTIKTIQDLLAVGDKEGVRDIITGQEGGLSDIFKFNPPGVFGFGALGPEGQGLPISLAESLGITPGSTLRDLTSEQLLGIGRFESERLGFQIPGPEPSSVIQTSIPNLSLIDIIDRFGVTASQAANIRAISEDNFGDFDFGSNTGRGVGSVLQRPDINTTLQDSSNVSNIEFQGLSAEEIARRLTGGNISNF